MNTNMMGISAGVASHTKQVRLQALVVAILAITCAFVVSTKQINYTYPVEALLKTIIKDNSIIEDHLYKVRL